MSAEHYKSVVNDYIRLMTAGDWQSVADLYAENATLEDPVGTEAIRGIAAITEFYKKNTHPSVALKLNLLGAIRVAGNQAAFPFGVTLTLEGKRMRVEVIDIFQFDAQGKIVSMKAYFGPENFVPAE